MNRRQRKLAAQAAQRASARVTVVGVLAGFAGMLVLSAIGIALAGFILLLSPVAVPVLLFVNWLRRRSFLARHAGESLLVVSRRRGWRDFLVNNVEPVLPPRTRCVWLGVEDPNSDVMFFILWRMKRPAGLRRPYLIVIPEDRPRMHFVPMHDALLPFKARAKVSADTRRQVAAAIEAEIKRNP